MTELFELVFRSPFSYFGSLAILFLCLLFAESTFSNALRLLNRVFRTLNVICRGWPPAHLDADGDWNPNEESEPTV